jgi:hypothetical protein
MEELYALKLKKRAAKAGSWATQEYSNLPEKWAPFNRAREFRVEFKASGENDLAEREFGEFFREFTATFWGFLKLTHLFGFLILGFVN